MFEKPYSPEPTLNTSMSLDLNVDFSHHQPSSESDDTSSSSIIVDEDHSIPNNNDNRPLPTTLFFDILNNTHHHTPPPDPTTAAPTMPLFPSSPAVAPHWLNLSFPDPGKQPAQPWSSQNLQHQKKPEAKKIRRGPQSRSSPYRGVTFYRRTGRWESHIWECGKQVYLGGFDTAHAAARAYDRAAIKFRGAEADINFDLTDYDQDKKPMAELSKEEFVQLLRRQSTGFTRTRSKLYRGLLCRSVASDEHFVNALRYNDVTNVDAGTYGRGNLTVIPIDKGSYGALDLSLGVASTSVYTQLGRERVCMFDGSAAPVLCGQPAHDFSKPSPVAWHFARPSGSEYLSGNKNGMAERRSMATDPALRFQDRIAQVQLVGSTMAPSQLPAASSGFLTGLPTAPSGMRTSKPPGNAFYFGG